MYILVESDVSGKTTAENITMGKGWNCVIRAHKLAFESLWRILWPNFLQWIEDNDKAIDHSVTVLADSLRSPQKWGPCDDCSML